MSTRVKEAIKTALAVVLVYGIALKSGWMNPYWGAFVVALIALPTAGQSIQKGLLRIGGTIPGCVAAVVVLALAPQNRWLFLLLICVWIFITAYMCLQDRRRSYLWAVAGYTALVIASAPGSSEHLFQSALFRTLETQLGIAVYLLVSVFLWPQTNLGAIKKTGGDLIACQAERVRAGFAAMKSQDARSDLGQLHTREVKLLGLYAQALQAEGSESWEVHELRDVWARLQGLSTELAEVVDRWQMSLAELAGIDVDKALPDLPVFCAELGDRLDEVWRLLSGAPPAHELQPVSLRLDPTAFSALSTLDRAAITLTVKQLERLEKLTGSMRACARIFAGAQTGGSPDPVGQAASERVRPRLPLIDPDNLRGAAFAALSTAVGFLVWIFFNPPGHAGWFVIPGALGMYIIQTPQLRATVFLKPLALTVPLAFATYLLVLPRLSTFPELAAVIFTLMFVNCFFNTGILQLSGSIAIIYIIAIQNHQVYVFAPIANGVLFLFLGFPFVYALSYMMSSARPEKALLALVARFFRNAEFLLSRETPISEHAPSAAERWKIQQCRRDIRTLPQKIAPWGAMINHELFPGNSPEQVKTLVTSLQALAYRIDDALTAGGAGHAEPFDLDMDIAHWRSGLGTAFSRLAVQPDALPQDDSRQTVESWVRGFETRVSEATERAAGDATEEQLEGFFHVVGGYRGVTAAAAAYVKAAGDIDWAHWREEKFS